MNPYIFLALRQAKSHPPNNASFSLLNAAKARNDLIVIINIPFIQIEN